MKEPISGLRTWRLGVGFFGVVFAYIIFEAFSIEYRSRNQQVGLVGMLAAACIAITAIGVAYGKPILSVVRRSSVKKTDFVTLTEPLAHSLEGADEVAIRLLLKIVAGNHKQAVIFMRDRRLMVQESEGGAPIECDEVRIPSNQKDVTPDSVLAGIWNLGSISKSSGIRTKRVLYTSTYSYPAGNILSRIVLRAVDDGLRVSCWHGIPSVLWKIGSRVSQWRNVARSGRATHATLA